MGKERKVLVIPRHSVFVRFIEIPSTDDSEIRTMVEFQAVKDIPYSTEDMVVGYRNLGSYKKGFSSLMLAVASKAKIEEVMAAKEGHGFEIDAIRLHTELLYLFLLKKGAVDKDKVNFIIHIGKDDSELMIIDKTRPIFSRGFRNNEKFLEEIDRSALAFEKDRDNPAIENIVVAYASDIDIEEARPYIEGHFAIPVNFFEYSDDFRIVDLQAEIDLLPLEISRKNRILDRRRENLVTYSLIGLIMILFFTSLSFKLHEKKRFLKVSSSRLNKMRSEITRLDRFVKKTDIAKANIERGKFIVDILKKSYNFIPSDISISGLNYDGEAIVSYKGTSKDMSRVLDFVKRLEGSGFFEKVEVKYAAKKEVRGEDLTDFNINCNLDLGKAL